MVDFIVFCAILIGIFNGLSKLNVSNGGGYKKCDNLLEFLFFNNNK
jgi:hypothetical protein